MARKTYTTPDAPAPVAQYSQVARVGPVVAVAGQVGIDAATGRVVGPGVAEQTTQCLANVRAALQAAGLTLDNLVRLDCYVTEAADVAAFNEAYATWFPENAPARTTVIVGLMKGLRVEITALAVAH